MRFKIDLELKNEYYPLDYRPTVISLFKHCLTVYENGMYFNNYYEIGKQKPFTFAVGLPDSIFTKERILVPNKKMDITFSTSDIGTGITFFNALMVQKNKPYPLADGNTMIVKNISVEKEFIITKDTIDVVFKSPLCVREHNKEKNLDIYYSCEKEGFITVFNKVLDLQISKSNLLPASVLKDFSITPKECKKTVVRHHSQFIEVSVGIFKFKGNIELLNYLYSNGVGSRKSSGFGLFEIIRKETA